MIKSYVQRFECEKCMNDAGDCPRFDAKVGEYEAPPCPRCGDSEWVYRHMPEIKLEDPPADVYYPRYID